MQSLRELLSRFRRWRAWRALRRSSAASAAGLLHDLPTSRPILRDVSRHGVRVYSLCVSCGAHLSASATLCEGCARSRSLPNS
ncbi:MAG: hypothetical protein HOQ17_08310 [Gemmatimonadaceae bacterium]|nr:hypothetical protein [Gemmatimonadaceae bacterium]NUO94145.1 hypothetical protein [Gemmatimonadaceae bacterium]NUP55367.1 hypothetical protein [Gemmatimonadaceae bacterium]NUP69955.1 hypothetical protein [Gemmatimonadaceae bacterium]NUR35713.1 hypothetical protein [Gemmatimonadaceae bacterium]